MTQTLVFLCTRTSCKLQLGNSFGRLTMTKAAITALFLVCTIYLLSAIILFSRDLCTLPDIPPSMVSFDAPTTRSTKIAFPNISCHVENTTGTSALSLEQKAIQAFVISSHRSQFQKFLYKNRASVPGNMSITWFPALNGRDQTVLDEFANLTGLRPILATSKDEGYASPHHVGCFMSHWNILRIAKAGWQAVGSFPKALLVFEDDAVCAKSVMAEITKTLPLLPPDWDILYVGGKPFSYYYTDNQYLRNRSKLTAFSQEEFKDLLCQGRFGRTDTGPFEPDGGRNLSLNLPYWRIKYITNTQSYLVNPQRIDRILHLLEHPSGQQPIDIMLADGARRGNLNLFMTTMEYCFQMRTVDRVVQPRIWEGYYYVTGLSEYRWGSMFHAKCPSKP